MILNWIFLEVERSIYLPKYQVLRSCISLNQCTFCNINRAILRIKKPICVVFDILRYFLYERLWIAHNAQNLR